MKKRTVLLILILIPILTYSQNTPVITPTLGKELNYSKADYKFWKAAKELSDSISYDAYLKLPENTKTAIDSIESGEGPFTGGVGCSWYCGGGPYKITASSFLDTNDKYSFDNIHDFNLQNAWVPAGKNGIGESISFSFKSNSPRITAIIIYNGYLKRKKTWQNNSRAKKIILKINGKTIAILDVKDTTAPQRFEINPIRSEVENIDLILTLEILESYQGDTFSDLAISEVNFDGIDVH